MFEGYTTQREDNSHVQSFKDLHYVANDQSKILIAVPSLLHIKPIEPRPDQERLQICYLAVYLLFCRCDFLTSYDKRGACDQEDENGGQKRSRRPSARCEHKELNLAPSRCSYTLYPRTRQGAAALNSCIINTRLSCSGSLQNGRFCLLIKRGQGWGGRGVSH